MLELLVLLQLAQVIKLYLLLDKKTVDLLEIASLLVFLLPLIKRFHTCFDLRQ